MDVEGQWQPPENWPESSPPLPGWVRTADGTWTAPTIPPPAAPDSPPLTQSNGRPVAEPPRVTTARPQSVAPDHNPATSKAPDQPNPVDKPPADKEPERETFSLQKEKSVSARPDSVEEPRIGLGFATDVEHIDTQALEQDRNRRAFIAAVTAAVIAGMLGAGIVLLILL